MAAWESVRFSTDDIPERDRIAWWREGFGQKVLGLDYEPEPGVPFRAWGIARAFSGLHVVSGSSSAHRVERTRGLLADGRNHVCLLVVRGAAAQGWQAQRECAIQSGDAFVHSSAEPYGIAVSATMYCWNVSVPQAALAPLVKDLGSAFGRRIDGRSEALRLLMGYASLLQLGDVPASPELQHSAVSHVHDLMALALGATRDAKEMAEGRGLRAARLNAIKADVLRNLGSSKLSVDAVAARQGVSPRYVQMLFESEGTTFSAFVREKRLAWARRMLIDPRFAHQSIAETTYLSGFGDLSTFNRGFRAQFAMSPRDARQARPPSGEPA